MAISRKSEPDKPNTKLHRVSRDEPIGHKVKKGSKLDCIACKGRNPQCGGCKGKGFIVA